MNLATIPADVAFLDALAARWLATQDDPSRGLILLPTRRAARALADSFLRASEGRPMLLPRITAVGAPDEAPLSLAGALDLPPAIAPLPRLAALSRMILALPADQGGACGADAAWMLARELAALMDEADRAEIDLATALSRAAEGEHAAHWDITLRFMRIVSEAWPRFLADGGLINPVTRQVRLLDAQARAWQVAPPDAPVWTAGATGAIPAVGRLLRVIAHLPRGQVVLPGLDLAMAEPAWEQLAPSHPQAALKSLLTLLDARRGDVAEWPGPPVAPSGRTRLLSRALLPAQALGEWRAPEPPTLDGLRRLRPSDPQEEAAAIALILRDALERPGARAALITPDRALATRVAAELLRWGVVADDSAGEKLGETPPALFLRLLAAALVAGLAPVALLSVLKHPLAAAGLDPAACRASARRLERACLRGPAPQPGLTGLRLATRDTPALHGFLDRLETCLAPGLRLAAGLATPAEQFTGLIEAAEALAGSDTESGAARLWPHEEGEALATLLAEALPALRDLPAQPLAALPGLLDALLDGPSVRTRRALRGRNGAEHPRVFIWGLLEARLQTADVMVLGSLVEGVWPPATDPGPWMSRPMRARAGLPSPEERVGQAAHDFVSATCAGAELVLSCPARRDGAPAVPSRWLARIDALLAGQGAALPAHPAAFWATRLDLPAGPPCPVAPPAPRPPLALRPRKLSVTAIETWLADPYAIHARHILKLRVLDPLEQGTDAADYGQLVHEGMRRFLAQAEAGWPADPQAALRAAMDLALRAANIRPALLAWWTPRLHRIADWVAAEETRRRALGVPAHIASECAGQWEMDVPGGFALTGRADRIERRTDGTLAILDYKTGQPPSQTAVQSGAKPQLALEAAMAAHGAFGAALRGTATELVYWYLSGGAQPGAARPLKPESLGALIADAEDGLRALIARFDNPDQPYLSHPHPGRLPAFSDYAQLARVGEWSQAGDEESGE